MNRRIENGYVLVLDAAGQVISRVPVDEPAAQVARIPKYEVRRQLSLPEKVALATRAKLDGTPLSAQHRAIVDVIERDYDAAPDPINVADPDFQLAMQTLAELGVLQPTTPAKLKALQA